MTEQQAHRHLGPRIFVAGVGLMLLGSGLELIAGDTTLVDTIHRAGWLWPSIVLETCGAPALGCALAAAGGAVLVTGWRQGWFRTSAGT